MPINHLTEINEVLKKWGEQYAKISQLDAFIEAKTKGYLDAIDLSNS